MRKFNFVINTNFKYPVLLTYYSRIIYLQCGCWMSTLISKFLSNNHGLRVAVETLKNWPVLSYFNLLIFLFLVHCLRIQQAVILPMLLSKLILWIRHWVWRKEDLCWVSFNVAKDAVNLTHNVFSPSTNISKLTDPYF